MKVESPAFSNFRTLLDIWDRHLHLESLSEDEKEMEDFSFFFVKDGQPFAATELSRLAFAKMKSNDEEDKKWAKDASFVAVPLNKTGENSTENVFNIKDLKKITVVTKEEIDKILKNLKK